MSFVACARESSAHRLSAPVHWHCEQGALGPHKGSARLDTETRACVTGCTDCRNTGISGVRGAAGCSGMLLRLTVLDAEQVGQHGVYIVTTLGSLFIKLGGNGLHVDA